LTSPTHAAYQTEILDLVKSDPRKAFTRFREILQTTPLAHNTCHGIAHQMGHEAFESFGFQKAMAYQDAICGGGYIHGIIEARFGLLQEKDIMNQLPTICDEGNGACYHGIGHGLMIATKLNITTSLTYCDVLPGLGRRNCYDGVWMHIFDLEETGLHEVADAPSVNDEGFRAKMLAFCKNAGTAYKTSCYFYLPRIYAHFDETPFEVYAKLCGEVEDGYSAACAAGVGHSLMKYHIDNPSITFARCSGFVASDMVAACKEGGSLYYLYDKITTATVAPTKTEQAQLCNIFTDPKDMAVCKKVNLYRESL
jgi:hypothetical protein